MQILVWEDKHCTNYYDASTPEQLDASARHIIEVLVDNDYVHDPGTWEDVDLQYSGIDFELAALDDEAVKALPTDGLRKEALRHRQSLAYRKRSHEQAVEDYNLATALAKGAGKQGQAWRFLSDRNGFEYENFALETVESFA